MRVKPPQALLFSKGPVSVVLNLRYVKKLFRFKLMILKPGIIKDNNSKCQYQKIVVINVNICVTLKSNRTCVFWWEVVKRASKYSTTDIVMYACQMKTRTYESHQLNTNLNGLSYFKGRNFHGQKLSRVSKIAKFREFKFREFHSMKKFYGKNFRDFMKIFIFLMAITFAND